MVRFVLATWREYWSSLIETGWPEFARCGPNNRTHGSKSDRKREDSAKTRSAGINWPEKPTPNHLLQQTGRKRPATEQRG